MCESKIGQSVVLFALDVSIFCSAASVVFHTSSHLLMKLSYGFVIHQHLHSLAFYLTIYPYQLQI